ncbi:MAG: tetratricopeptide repeat protein [bacterium]
MAADADIDKLDNILEECKYLIDANPQKAKIFAEQAIEISEQFNLQDKLGQAYAYLSRIIFLLDGASKSIKICKKAIKLLENAAPNDIQGLALLNLGHCHIKRGEIVQGLRSFQKAEEIYLKINLPVGQASALNGQGVAYKEMGLIERALDCYYRVKEIGNKYNNKVAQAASLNNIANLFIYEKEYDQALENLFKALEINQELERKAGIAHCLLNIGNIYALQDNPKKAVGYLRQAEKSWREIGSKNMIIPSLILLGEVHYKLDDPEQALEILNQAINFAEESESSMLTGQAKIKIGMIYFKLNRDLKAENEILEAIELMENREDALDYLIDGCKYLSEYYERIDEDRKALKYFKKYYDYQNKIMNRKIGQNLEKFKLKSEYQSSEIQREFLSKKNQELEQLNFKLSNALNKVKQLQGMLPICANCKKIRTDEGYWEQIEEYISEHSEAIFTHGVCPDCMKIYFNQEDQDKDI